MTTTTAAVPFLDLHAMHAEIRPALDAVWEQTLTSGGFVGGAALADFESRWATYCDTTHAVGVGNGTDALELILRALDLAPDAEVLVPANTFVATAEAVVLAGARPRFVDVDPDTLLITPEAVAAAIGPDVAAVVVVHLFGNMPDMAGLRQVTDEAGIALIEDAAQAHGAIADGRRAGSFGVAAAFSFYPGKNLGAFGDGGAVVTDDADLAEHVRSLANHGRDVDDRHSHPNLGRNSRLDGLQAGILGAKLDRLDDWNGGRRAAAAAYRHHLADLGLAPVPSMPGTESVHHLLVVEVPHREAVQASLTRQGVATGIHYPVPCHLNLPYRRYAAGPLPVVERAASRILSLPMYPHLEVGAVDHVCAALGTALQEVGA